MQSIDTGKRVYMIIQNIYLFIRNHYLDYRFHKQNKANRVFIARKAIVRRDCRLEGNNYIAGNIYACDIGYGTYIHRNSVLNSVSVGRFCSIGEDVDISLFEHAISQVSTSPLFYRKDNRSGLRTFASKDTFQDLKKLDNGFAVEIGNDVWIGNHVSIRNGVKIGDGAVIGTGAVVTRDVEPYSIVCGVPARHVRYRFEKSTIEKMLKIQWWNKELDWLEENGQYFENVEDFTDRFKELV